MNSARWRARRNRAVKRAGTRCEFTDKAGKRCWAQARLHVHHLTYINFGRERAKDLQVLCEDHHAVIEIRKFKCPHQLTPCVVDDVAAMAIWKRFRARHPKDWVAALKAAQAALSCGVCAKNNDKTRTG